MQLQSRVPVVEGETRQNAAAAALLSAALATEATEAAADVAGREAIQCAVYAGPMRWRWHPGGRGARYQSLQTSGRTRGKRALRPARRHIEPFPAAALRLLPGTPFAVAASTNAEFLRTLSQDRLFFSFRATAGLRQPQGARPYGGWEAPGAGIRGHFVGHYLTALATGAASGDASLAALARSALEVLEECQRAHTSAGRGGYLSAFPASEFEKVEVLCIMSAGCNAWVPHYATRACLRLAPPPRPSASLCANEPSARHPAALRARAVAARRHLSTRPPIHSAAKVLSGLLSVTSTVTSG